MALIKRLKNYLHWPVSKDFGGSKTKTKAFNPITDKIKSLFSPEDIERAYNNPNAEYNFSLEGYNILEPIWVSLTHYITALKAYQELNRRYNINDNEVLRRGVHENLEFLKSEISAGVGIPTEQLFGPMEAESSLMVNERAYLENFRERVRFYERPNTPQTHVSTKGILEKEKKPKPREFKVSDLITLRLEGSGDLDIFRYGKKLQTNIYVKGIKFRQCKFLLLNLEVGNNYEEIESIDQAKELLEVKEEDIIDLNTLTDTMDDLKPNYDGQLERSKPKISILPEEEFWGHCSNIQTFVEYDYDLRILHSNLSLPLLKELAQHDEKAKLRLKEQIAEKVEKGGYSAFCTHFNIIHNYFTKEERETLKEFVEFPEDEPPIVGMKEVIFENDSPTLDEIERELNEI